jgi:hypothetical protein
VYFGRVREEVEVILVVRQPLQERLPVVGPHRRLDAGMKLDVRREQPRGETRPRRAHGETQLAGIQRAHSRERFLEACERAEHVLARFVEPPASVGEVDAPADLLEQRNADGVGELPDLPGRRRLRHVQLLRGAGEAAQAGTRLEETELRQRSVLEVAVDIRR